MRQLPTLSTLIADGVMTRFLYYTMGELWYKVDGDYGFIFPVSVDEVERGVLGRDIHACNMTPYINRYRNKLELEIALDQI